MHSACMQSALVHLLLKKFAAEGKYGVVEPEEGGSSGRERWPFVLRVSQKGV